MRSLTVVICLKNQALDQFLKEVLKCNQKVIRVGSQSQSAQSPLERDLDVKLHQMEQTYRAESAKTIAYATRQSQKRQFFALSTSLDYPSQVPLVAGTFSLFYSQKSVH